MKGIILAGGSGTRLYPITRGISKQLLPVYDKPMVYYPLSVLMLAGIREILIITTPQDQANFKALLGDGSQWGIYLSYVVQQSPDGLAQAFILGDKFLDGDSCCLVLGDNIFYGQGFREMLQNAIKDTEKENKATVFGNLVHHPERYGVVEFDSQGNAISIEEKPKNPKSDYAVIGVYFYPNDVVSKAKQVKPSQRGELEITTLNCDYLSESRLKVKLMGRGFAWLDTGTHSSLLEASCFVHTLQKRQALKIACLEEIAYKLGFINQEQLLNLAEPMKKNDYGRYLIQLAGEKK